MSSWSADRATGGARLRGRLRSRLRSRLRRVLALVRGVDVARGVGLTEQLGHRVQLVVDLDVVLVVEVPLVEGGLDLVPGELGPHESGELFRGETGLRLHPELA